MIFHRIKIKRWKNLEDKETELGPGINVIKGPNESGKSTFQTAVLDGLYEKPGSRKKELKDSVSWGSEDFPFISIEGEVDKGSFKLEKDFQSKSVKLEYDQDEITSAQKVEEWTAENIGCATSEMFTACACVEEEKIKIPKLDMKSTSSKIIMERLQSMLTGAPGGSPAQVMKKIKSRRNEIKSKPTKKLPDGGVLFSLNARIEQTSSKLQKLKDNIKSFYGSEYEYEKITERISFLEKEYQNLSKASEKHRHILEAEKRHEELNHTMEKLLKAEKLNDELTQKLKSMLELTAFEGREEDIKQLKEITAEKKRIEKDISGPVIKTEKEPKSPGTTLILLIILIVVSFAGGLVASLLKDNNIFLIGGTAVSFFFILAALIIYIKSLKSGVSDDDHIQKFLDDERSLTDIDLRIDEITGEIGKEDPDDCLEAFNEYVSLKQSAFVLNERLEDLLDDTKPSLITGKITETSIELRSEKVVLETLAPFRIDDPVKFSSLEEGLKIKQLELSKLTKQQSVLQGRMESHDFDPDELNELEELENTLLQRRNYWERQVRVQQHVLDVLEGASQAVMGKAGDVIEKEMGPIISDITAGRYEKIDADDELSLSVFSKEKNDWVSAEDLSLATREQVHFAARMALVKLITDGKKPPILLDDPFSHYDDARLKSVMGLLKKYAEEYQIVIFSPNSRYDEYASKVIIL
jgi:AAA domain